MNSKVTHTKYYSIRVGALPKGCTHCVKGAKLVLFVTGVCESGCWYCPLSEKKKGADKIVANEWWVKEDKDIIKEARLCEAEGAGITGGDPLCKPKKTVYLIKLLKKEFGPSFHIHLYTDGKRVTQKILKDLYDAGLDEIRFHPDFTKGKDTDVSMIELALGYDWDLGCEIPVIPGKLAATKAFLKKIEKVGVGFVNLNEFEIADTNEITMYEHGFKAISDEQSAVEGSFEMGEKLMQFISEKTSLRAHFCTSKLKDGVQLRNRMLRRAKNVASDADIITEDGLLIRGAIYTKKTMPGFGRERAAGKVIEKETLELKALLRKMKKLWKLEGNLAFIDDERGRIIIGAWILEEVAQDIKDWGFHPVVLEEYPTWDRLICDLIVL